MPRPRRSPSTVGHDQRRRLERTSVERRAQVVRQAALEVLAGDAADRRRPVARDVDVHRTPPQRVAAPSASASYTSCGRADTCHSSTNSYARQRRASERRTTSAPRPRRSGRSSCVGTSSPSDGRPGPALGSSRSCTVRAASPPQHRAASAKWPERAVDWPWRDAVSLREMDGGAIGDAFGTGDPFTVGVEEELFLVDPSAARRPTPRRRCIPPPGRRGGRIERELHACQVELITGVCGRAADAARALAGCAAPCWRPAPAARSGYPPVGPRGRGGDHRQGALRAHPRPARGRGRDARRGAARARRHARPRDRDPVFNGLRRHLPLLLALGANSPFRHGRDTGLASAREVTLRSWPRSGVPRAMRDFADFAATRACSRAPPTSPTTPGSGGSCGRTRGSARSRSARSTHRPSSPPRRRSSRSCSAWRATAPSTAAAPIHPSSCSTRGSSALRDSAPGPCSRTWRGAGAGCGPARASAGDGVAVCVGARLRRAARCAAGAHRNAWRGGPPARAARDRGDVRAAARARRANRGSVGAVAARGPRRP